MQLHLVCYRAFQKWLHVNAIDSGWHSAVQAFIWYPTGTVYKCPLLLLSPLWQMPLWHQVAHATCYPECHIFPVYIRQAVLYSIQWILVKLYTQSVYYSRPTSRIFCNQLWWMKIISSCLYTIIKIWTNNQKVTIFHLYHNNNWSKAPCSQKEYIKQIVVCRNHSTLQIGLTR